MRRLAYVVLGVLLLLFGLIGFTAVTDDHTASNSQTLMLGLATSASFVSPGWCV